MNVSLTNFKFFFASQPSHASMPLIDLTFTKVTLVGANVSNRIKRNTKTAITPSKIDIVNEAGKPKVKRT